MAEMHKSLNLVLLGKAGVGKSATGNTILGREAFISKKSFTSVTQKVAVVSRTVCGRPVTVYDTPGLDSEQNEETIQQINEVLQKCESHPCAFLLVIKADRFTEEEIKTVEKIEKVLGVKRKRKTWILITSGDQLEDDDMTIEEFISDYEALKKLLQKYDQRYCVFNNKNSGQSRHTEQVQELLKKINGTEVANVKQLPLKTNIQKNIEPDTPADIISSRRIVLLGKSGVGRSSAANTILGQNEFRCMRGMTPVTRECSDAHATVSGRSVSVVDTPGLFHSEMNPEELMKEIARSVYLSSLGLHAFIIVFRADDRFTDHEQQIPQQIEMMFGQEVLKYSIILFTHGDLLEEESVEELIEENSALRDLVGQCGGRFHVFNNRDVNNRDQVNDLLKKIDTMIEQNGGGHYSHQMYEDAQRFRQEEEERRQREEKERRQREEEERRQREEKEKRQRGEEERRQRLKRIQRLKEKRHGLEEERQRLEEERQRFERILIWGLTRPMRIQRLEEERQILEEKRQRLEEEVQRLERIQRLEEEVQRLEEEVQRLKRIQRSEEERQRGSCVCL